MRTTTTSLFPRESFSALFQTAAGQFQKFSSSSFPSSSRMAMQNFKKNFKKNYIVFIPILIVGIVILFFVGSFLQKSVGTSDVRGAKDQRVGINVPLSVETLNKSYSFTVNDANGKLIKVKFQIQNVEMRDQIVLRGQPYSAVKGKVFIIANLKIVNDSTQSASVYTRDYLRLIVDNSSDKLAPEIHNDPVQIQAISAKLTRAGFAIDDKAQKLVLQVGEITGKKDSIELHLQD